MVGAGTKTRAFVFAITVASFATGAIADQQKADEQDMLNRARQEAEERRKPRRLEGTVEIGAPRVTGDTAEARKREDELQRLSDKLRQASQLRAARPTSPVATGPAAVGPTAVGGPWTSEVTVAPPEASRQPFHPESRSALGNRIAADTERLKSDTHATVLMVLSPGNRGIRRYEKTADPILCSNDGCYISNGSDTAARYISLRRSFGMLNTFGPRAGACRNHTGCVFRGVDISAPNAILQPVDLRVMHHDRRAIKAALADETCKVDAGRLTCGKPIRGDDFTLWVVPESVAARAGADALLRAVNEGLPEATRRAAIAR